MAEAIRITMGGHDVNLVSVLPAKFKCPLCNLLIRDAIQTYRGERACNSCYYDAKEKGNTSVCPIDKEPITDVQIFQDNYARREILQLPVYCNNRQKGCMWEGIVIAIPDHLLQCPFEFVCCELCGDCVIRQDIDNHVEGACPIRPLECGYCKEIFQAQVLREHELKCPRRPIECPYLCGKDIGLEELYNHVQNCSKIVEGSICPYQLVGCKWRYALDSKESLDKHMQMTVHVHAALAISNVEFFKASNKKMAEELMVEQRLCEQLAKKIEDGRNEKMAMALKVNMIEGKLCNDQKECDEIKEVFTRGVEKVKEDLKEIDTLTKANSLRGINEKLVVMNVQINQMENIAVSTQPIPAFHGQSDVTPEEVKNSIAKIDGMENRGAMLSANLADLELKLQLLENTSYDGHQLWKIDNVDYRRNQAVTGRVTALHSAPWHQGRGEYKFCSRLYLNGDGMGRGTHVSLFFVLMKSEYDALLEWPFSQRVTFRLINPYNQEESAEESFIPDRNSSSFKRPTRDMNIAAGCPMFIRKENLARFIIEDVIFIDVRVTPT